MLLLLQCFWVLGLLFLRQGSCQQIIDASDAKLVSPNYQVGLELEEICITYVTTYLVAATNGPDLIPLTRTTGYDGNLDPVDTLTQPCTDSQSGPGIGPSQGVVSQTEDSQGTASRGRWSDPLPLVVSC